MYVESFYEYRQQIMDMEIETEMHKVEEAVLEKLTSIFAHQQFFSIQDFSSVLAYSFFENHEPALKISKALNFGNLEFMAILQDKKGFKMAFLQDLEGRYDTL